MLRAPNRFGTNSAKWDALSAMFGDQDPQSLISLWVADMDFCSPDSVWEALKDKCDHGIVGYSLVPEGYYTEFIKWEKERHGYEVKKDWIRFSSGVVPAINWFVNMYTQPGDSCIILTPCYYPFRNAVINNDRKPISCDLKCDDKGYYTIDFAKFERDIEDNKVKMFILSSPHNPVGRVWTKEELKKLLDICRKNNVLVLSDEIHQDLAISGPKHTPSATLGSYDDMLITLTAVSKTFNLAGFSNSYIIIPDEKLREMYDKFTTGMAIGSGNALGYIAVEAAIRGGREWLAEVIEVVRENFKIIKTLEEKLPGVVVSPLEGTYLAWVNLRAYGIGLDNEKEFVQEKARMAVDFGDWFGPAGTGYIRVNLATPTENVQKAIEGLVKALKK